MTGKTHILGGLAAGVAVQYVGWHSQDIVFLGACMAGALIPDICHSGSKIGRKLPILSHAIRLVFGHRTMTHSLVFSIALGILLMALQLPSDLVWGTLIGVGSHLLLDAATARGIQLFWPVPLKIRLPFYTHTGGVIEHVLMLAMVLVTVYLGYQMYLV